MSHRPQRKEKDCLNCGTIVHGHYCQVCGQENTEPKETFWSMLRHFFEDITHFDGKFFTSLKDLLFKPGFLSSEYIRGRRASYLNPVRMYVFTSAVFFLILFAISNPRAAGKLNGDDPMTPSRRDSMATRLDRKLKKNAANENYRQQIRLLRDTTREVKPSDLLPFEDTWTFMSPMGPRKYKSIKEYDSVQAALPKAERDNWMKRKWNRKSASLTEKYRHSGAESMGDIGEIFMHKLPYLLFVSLPFFALILKLLYIRRKNFYYADHGIFSIHHYIFSFILLLVFLSISELEDWIKGGAWEWLELVVFLIWPVYLFIAMRKFYKQGFWKTLGKFILLNILGLFALLILFVIFGLFSIFQL